MHTTAQAVPATTRRTGRLRAGLAATAVAAVSLAGLTLGSGSAAAATTVLVSPGNLQGFTFTETRATGHNDFTAAGLHVYTEGSTSTDKAAGYKVLAAPVSLATVAAGPDPALNLTTVTGGKPGYQMALDKDGDGGFDGYLVGEPGSYGDKWWDNSGSYTATTSTDLAGCGYKLCASLDAIAAAYPAATITAIGYSLGSGLEGDVLLNSMTFVDTTYTFGLDPVLPPATGPVDLSLQLTATPLSDRGANIPVSVTVRNNGANPSGPTSATVGFFPALQVVETNGTKNADGTVTFAVPYLAPGASQTFTLTAAGSAGFRIAFSGGFVAPAAGQADPNLFNNIGVVPVITR